MTRGGAAWKLVGLITRRSQVQILPPLPNQIKGLRQNRSPFLFALNLISNPISNLHVKNRLRKARIVPLLLGVNLETTKFPSENWYKWF